jgi:hypothetical protein
MQKAWLSTVVAFDNTSRKYLFNTLGAFFENTTTTIKNLAADVTVGFRDLLLGPSSTLGLRVAGFGSLALIALLLLWLMNHWHLRRTSAIPRILRHVDKKSQRQLAADLFFFDDLLRLLARLGPRKTPEQTPREYVEHFAPQLRNASSDARFLIGTFYAIRFGALRMTAALRQQIDAALARIRHQIHNPPTPPGKT